MHFSTKVVHHVKITCCFFAGSLLASVLISFHEADVFSRSFLVLVLSCVSTNAGEPILLLFLFYLFYYRFTPLNYNSNDYDNVINSYDNNNNNNNNNYDYD